jgi:hypothetical protein
VLGIPRRATNLYVNVSTPDQWLAEDHCVFPSGRFGYATTYDDILKRESAVLLRYLLAGDVNPWGFHALNVRAYDGTHSLLGDLVDRTLAAYSQLVTVPVPDPPMNGLGQQVATRMQFNAALPQLSVALTTDASGSRFLQVSSPVAATVAITGLAIKGAETYAGQTIGHLRLNGSRAVTVRVS